MTHLIVKQLIHKQIFLVLMSNLILAAGRLLVSPWCLMRLSSITKDDHCLQLLHRHAGLLSRYRFSVIVAFGAGFVVMICSAAGIFLLSAKQFGCDIVYRCNPALLLWLVVTSVHLTLLAYSCVLALFLISSCLTEDIAQFIKRFEISPQHQFLSVESAWEHFVLLRVTIQRISNQWQFLISTMTLISLLSLALAALVLHYDLSTFSLVTCVLAAVNLIPLTTLLLLSLLRVNDELDTALPHAITMCPYLSIQDRCNLLKMVRSTPAHFTVIGITINRAALSQAVVAIAAAMFSAIFTALR